MPRYLAIEWGRGGVRGLDAEVSNSRVAIRATLDHDWPEDLAASDDPEGVGTWLRSLVSTSEPGSCRLIVLVPREDVVGRLLELPEAGDETLSDLVRYQTGTRSSVPLAQLALDYLPLVSAPPQGGRWVQTATVPVRLLRHIQACASAAQFDLCAVGATTVAIGEAISHAQHLQGFSTSQKALIVRLVGKQLEVALWRGADLLFSHVSRAPQPKAAVAEVQRALMSHQSISGEDPIANVWLVASPESEAELCDDLETRLGCEVTRFAGPATDRAPSATAAVSVDGLPADAAPFVPSLGALLGQVRPAVPAVDFLHPRRREEKPDRTKMIAAIAAGAALFLLASLFIGSRLYLSSLDRQISETERTVRKHDQSWQSGERAREAEAFLSAWESRRVDWLDQMSRLGGEFPGTRRIYLDRWRFDLATGDTPATTEAIGFARQRQDGQRLKQRLAERVGLRIRPNPTGPPSSDSEYPVLLQVNAELPSPQPVDGRK